LLFSIIKKFSCQLNIIEELEQAARKKIQKSYPHKENNLSFLSLILSWDLSSIMILAIFKYVVIESYITDTKMGLFFFVS
jgi:hypothetical protein